MGLYGSTNYYSYSLASAPEERPIFGFPNPFSGVHPLIVSSLSVSAPLPRDIYLPSQKKKRKRRERRKATFASSPFLRALPRNVSCGGHFKGAFSPCAKLRRRTSFRKLSNNLLAPPNETIHFTGRNLPLFREAPSQLFIIYIQEYHAHTIFVPMHLSYWSRTRAFHLPLGPRLKKNKINY